MLCCYLHLWWYSIHQDSPLCPWGQTSTYTIPALPLIEYRGQFHKNLPSHWSDKKTKVSPADFFCWQVFPRKLGFVARFWQCNHFSVFQLLCFVPRIFPQKQRKRICQMRALGWTIKVSYRVWTTKICSIFLFTHICWQIKVFITSSCLLLLLSFLDFHSFLLLKDQTNHYHRSNPKTNCKHGDSESLLSLKKYKTLALPVKTPNCHL